MQAAAIERVEHMPISQILLHCSACWIPTPLPEMEGFFTKKCMPVAVRHNSKAGTFLSVELCWSHVNCQKCMEEHTCTHDTIFEENISETEGTEWPEKILIVRI